MDTGARARDRVDYVSAGNAAVEIVSARRATRPNKALPPSRGDAAAEMFHHADFVPRPSPFYTLHRPSRIDDRDYDRETQKRGRQRNTGGRRDTRERERETRGRNVEPSQRLNHSRIPNKLQREPLITTVDRNGSSKQRALRQRLIVILSPPRHEERD